MIVISGNMGYEPNIDAVKYFCREIFPLILAKEPCAHLWLVGALPTSAIKKLGNGSSVTVTGYVEDVRYYLNRAMVSICPVRPNVGTQTKVLEALATGTPVVTTSAGNQGVGGESGIHLYVADTPIEICERVVDLLRGSKWKDFSENGRKFVEENFQWSISVKKLESILNTIIDRPHSDRNRIA
jgi:glycosyltransferase involved in cell wall biosynthesis